MKRRDFLQAAASATVWAASVSARGRVDVEENALRYPLQNGWIANYLITPPEGVVLPDGDYRTKLAGTRPALLARLRNDGPLLPTTFVEGAAVPPAGTKSDTKPVWQVLTTDDDFLVDQAKWYGNAHYMRAWAFVEIASVGPSVNAPQNIVLQVWTNGPADVWADGNHLVQTTDFDYNNLRPSLVPLTLAPGKKTSLLIRREHIMPLGGPFGLAVRVLDEHHAPVADSLFTVSLPTRTGDVARRQQLEAVFARVYLSRDSYRKSGAAAEQVVALHVPRLNLPVGLVKIELRAGQKPIAQTTWDTGKKNPAGAIVLGSAANLPEGGYQAVLSGENNRRELRFRVYENAWHGTPVPTPYEARRQDVLREAVKRGVAKGAVPKGRINPWSSDQLRGEIAKMELGQWDDLSVPTLLGFINAIAGRTDGTDFRMADLLALFIRYGKNPRFPQELTAPIEKCVVGFKYWNDEPGATSANFLTENHRMAYHVSEVLAGQCFPDQIFTNNGKTGSWHQSHGEAKATDWMHKRGQFGFEEWDANGYLAADLNLLSCLADLAQNAEIKTLARNVMDKICFSIALNSFKGNFGSTHGRSGVEYIKTAYNEPIGAIPYLLWGLGSLNEHTDEVIALACMGYQVPDAIVAVAHDTPKALWSRDRQGLDPVRHGTEAQGPTDKATYKTASGMLCSAQSWRPGGGGYQQHIWQATFGPEAVVFVTSPAVISENGNNRPNFWSGNKTLPRVAQWKNTLIAVHKGRPSDWLQWTHAWFPTFAWDEWKVSDHWAFARKGDGYVALWAGNGLELTTHGDSAYRELRSPGRDNVWVCHIGDAPENNTFAQWQAQWEQAPVLSADKLSVECAGGPQGKDRFAFGWDGPLWLNGQETPITNFPHFDSPYCTAPWPASEMTIKAGGHETTLRFGKTG